MPEEVGGQTPSLRGRHGGVYAVQAEGGGVAYVQGWAVSRGLTIII